MTEAFGLSDIGCVRANNEDYFRIVPERGLYVLADRMGGARPASEAFAMAVDTVVESFQGIERRDSVALLAAVEAANNRVREAARTDPTLEGMGTTLVAVLDMGESLLLAECRRQASAICWTASRFQAVTQDQSWVNEVGRRSASAKTSLKTHPLRNVLTMAIGATANLVVNRYSTVVETALGGAAVERAGCLG